MNNRKFFSKVLVISITFLLVACGAQSTPEPTLIKLATVTSTLLPATETPTPSPTDTPTVTPTPVGGGNGLVLSENNCQQDTATKKFVCNQKIYVYDVNLHKASLFSPLEGYSLAGVSPNGKVLALLKTNGTKKDLFTMNLEKPDQTVLLHEDVKDAVWLSGTEWIGFIAVNSSGIRQVFIVHPDGSEITQVTKSAMGAVTLASVFNDGVFWGEGSVSSNGSIHIQKSKWTKMDGTETEYINFDKVFPSGKSIIATSMSPDISCWGCKFDLIDVATSEKKEIKLSLSNENASVGVQPLSDDKWLVHVWPTMADLNANVAPTNYIFSSDGTILLNFADLPHSTDPLVEDYYRLVGGDGGDLSGQRLSPDGNLLLIERRTFTKGPLTPEPTPAPRNGEISYYVLNLQTFEVQQLPELLFTSKDGIRDGISADSFYWIQIP